MSLNRRRWSNELLDSLMDFQSRESLQLVDSLEVEKTACTETANKSEDDKDTDITSMLADLHLKTSPAISISSQVSSEDNYVIDIAISDYDGNESDRSVSPNSILNLNVSEEAKIQSVKELNIIDDHFTKEAVSNVKDILNTSIIEDDNSECHSNTTPAQFDHLFNLNERLMEDVTSDSGNIKLSSCNSSDENSRDIQSIGSQLNERLTEIHTVSSDSGTIKLSSCNSSYQNSREMQSMDSQLNARFTEIHTVSSDSGTIKLSSCNSSVQNTMEKNLSEHQSCQLTEIRKQDEIHQRFFSSPVEDIKNTHDELIAEINTPDVWDALLCLEEALSPFEQSKESFHERSLEHHHILNRLSQKFKQTPTRFTEKLVSIIENSIVSESPTKQCTGDTSGISLHRMTGEFRKLCKFIEDESMPEWAPSLMNITCCEKTETSENERNKKNSDSETPKSNKNYGKDIMETPKNMIRRINDNSSHKCTPKLFDNFIAPKNKIRSNADTPIKQFTPSADKSFEYWESVCNIMCENNGSGKKNRRISLASKKSMEEMLTICERQMASLDDSTIDVRNSEPYKKTDSEIKLKLLNTPRSKSVSKIFSSTSEKTKTLSSMKKTEELMFYDDFELCKENEESKINENEVLKDDGELLKRSTDVKVSGKISSGYELFKRKDSNVNNDTFEKDFTPLPYSPMENIGTSPYNYSEDEQDCSLLIELAKRRQRCLDTAKLMMEIDKEDPITSGDTTCLETLYKLGIQDKTFTEVEDDVKFLNTLGQCLEYKNYLRDQSKPIKNMLQKFDSPDDFKKKATSMLKSKKSLNQQKSLNLITKNHEISTLNKPRVEQKNNLKTVQNKKITPRVAPKTISRIAPRSETKRPLSSDLKVTPGLIKKTSHSSGVSQSKVTPRTIPRMASRITPQVSKTSSQPQRKITPKLTPKPVTTSTSKTPTSEQKLTTTKKFTPRTTPKTTSLRPTPQLVRRLTPQSDQKRVTPRITPKSSVPKITVTPEGNDEPNNSPILREKPKNTPAPSPKLKLFATPGKSPITAPLGRRRPQSYFSEPTSKKPMLPATPQKLTYDSVKSPIGLYIKSTDNDLIQNVQSRTNDWLLTPVSNGHDGKSPQLKIKLSSKENKSPAVHCDENMVLPTVRYQSAKKVHLIDQKSSSLKSLTPNSKTKKLLEPIENTVVIRHEGRVIDNNSKTNYLDSETSIRVQRVAEKASSMQRKFM